MLYVSTRNTVNTYTAYRALSEPCAPDGGFYVPFHLPVYTAEEIAAFRSQSCCDTIAQILNLLFGLRLRSWDVEFAIGRTPYKLEQMQHKLLIAEVWRNPDASFRYLLKSLYSLMTDQKSMGKLPVGWSCIGIEIALLFGICSSIALLDQDLDVAVTAADFADLTAISYAKAMGLPINLTVCTCREDSAFWDLINRGEFNTSTVGTSTDRPDYLECFLYNTFGADAVNRYLYAQENKRNFGLDDEQQLKLSGSVFAAVVSTGRVDSLVSNMYRTNSYCLDFDSALAYGGLQDYRSATGVSNATLLFVKKRPERIKE